MLNLDKVCVEKAKLNGLDSGVEEFLKMFCEAEKNLGFQFSPAPN